MWKHPINLQDEIRRAYIKMGPYQPKLAEYPRTESGRQYRRFQYTWFDQFPRLKYSPSKDAVFCFPCFIFEKKVPVISHSPPKALEVGRGLMMGLDVHF
jgi:hypothetical protein